VKCDVGDIYKSLWRKPDVVKIGQKYQALYMEMYVLFIAAADLPLKSCFQVKWYVIRIAKEV
jgi:hypothetical protein